MTKYDNISQKIRVLNSRGTVLEHPSHAVIRENTNMYLQNTEYKEDYPVYVDPFVLILEREKWNTPIDDTESSNVKPPRKKVKHVGDFLGVTSQEYSPPNHANDMEKYMLSYQITKEDFEEPKPVNSSRMHEMPMEQHLGDIHNAFNLHSDVYNDGYDYSNTYTKPYPMSNYSRDLGPVGTREFVYGLPDMNNDTYIPTSYQGRGHTMIPRSMDLPNPLNSYDSRYRPTKPNSLMGTYAPNSMHPMISHGYREDWDPQTFPNHMMESRNPISTQTVCPQDRDIYYRNTSTLQTHPRGPPPNYPTPQPNYTTNSFNNYEPYYQGSYREEHISRVPLSEHSESYDEMNVSLKEYGMVNSEHESMNSSVSNHFMPNISSHSLPVPTHVIPSNHNLLKTSPHLISNVSNSITNGLNPRIGPSYSIKNGSNPSIPHGSNHSIPNRSDQSLPQVPNTSIPSLPNFSPNATLPPIPNPSTPNISNSSIPQVSKISIPKTYNHSQSSPKGLNNEDCPTKDSFIGKSEEESVTEAMGLGSSLIPSDALSTNSTDLNVDSLVKDYKKIHTVEPETPIEPLPLPRPREPLLIHLKVKDPKRLKNKLLDTRRKEPLPMEPNLAVSKPMEVVDKTDVEPVHSVEPVLNNDTPSQEKQEIPVHTEIVYSTDSMSDSDDTEQDLLNRLRSYNDRYINGKIEDILNQKVLYKDKFFLLSALEKQILKSDTQKRKRTSWR